MIIKRKYVSLKKLYMTDPASKSLIDEAFKPDPGKENGYEDSLEANRRTTMFNIPFGWWASIPHLEMLREGFEELDKTHPYDSGKSYKDVDHAEVLGWLDDGTIILLLTDRKGNAICVSECRADPNEKSRIMSIPFERNINMYPD